MRYADCHADREHYAKGMCKQCHNADYHRRNADRVAERNRHRREVAGEELRRRARDRYRENPDPHRERSRARNKTEEGKRYQREWARRNYVGERRERILLRQKVNPEWHRAANSRRRQSIQSGMDRVDRQLTLAYRRAIASDPCAYCGRHSDVMHDDHVIPLSRGGTDHWWNLVRACASCNLKKHNKTADEFLSLLKAEEK